jgi:hypothetical protein
VDRHTHPCQDVIAGTGIHSDKAESCIKMLKVEAVYLTDYETFADVTADLPRSFEDVYNTRRFHSVLGHLNPAGNSCKTSLPHSKAMMNLDPDHHQLSAIAVQPLPGN